MKGGIRSFNRFGGMIAAMALATFGMGPGAAAPKVGPVPIQIAGESDEDRAHRRRALKRPRRIILRDSLTWGGVGIRSIGPRWAKVAKVVPTSQVAQASDGTQVRRFSDGSWRLDPMKYGPATRYVFMARFLRAVRRDGTHHSTAEVSRRCKRAMTGHALMKLSKRMRRERSPERAVFQQSVRTRLRTAMQRMKPSMGGVA